MEQSGATTEAAPTSPSKLAEVIRNSRRSEIGQPTSEQIKLLLDLQFPIDCFIHWLEHNGGVGSLEAWIAYEYPSLGQIAIPGDYLIWYPEGVFARNCPRRLLPWWMREFSRQLQTGAGTAMEIARRLAR